MTRTHTTTATDALDDAFFDGRCFDLVRTATQRAAFAATGGDASKLTRALLDTLTDQAVAELAARWAAAVPTRTVEQCTNRLNRSLDRVATVLVCGRLAG